MDMRVEPAEIYSSTKLPCIKHHFRISAGPGAGKTHWLVNHIKQVLHTSEQLGKSRKVACITYTNTGVEIIRNRLGKSANQVEVSTIHSFLYRHVIKPYMHFIAHDYGFDVSRLDGHDDILINRSMVRDWLNQHTNQTSLRHPYSLSQLRDLPENFSRVTSWLSAICYKLDVNNNIVITADRTKSRINGRPLSGACLDLLEIDLEAFKMLHWNRGLLHHSDVLFFTYIIIEKYPFVLNVLRAKFPYFFVDEFQDSNPIQVEILRKIGQEETVVGIIGDKAQSIFGFQGAEPNQLDDFALDGLKDYEIRGNRRSTEDIISFLNHIRPEFEQKGKDGFNGDRPVIYIGGQLQALQAIQGSSEAQVVTLSWKNVTANALKNNIEGTNLDENLFDKLKEKDGNPQRYSLVTSCIKAVELSRESKIKEALKELKRYFEKSDQSKRYALDLLFLLNGRYSEYCDEPLMAFYKIIKTYPNFEGIRSFKAGKPKDFYNNTSYEHLSLCVNIIEDTSNNITIHKSKGAEFESVLLVLEKRKKENELNFILSPDLDKVGQRLKYVAVSRAIKNLYINVPELSQQDESIIRNLGLIDIVRL